MTLQLFPFSPQRPLSLLQLTSARPSHQWSAAEIGQLHEPDMEWSRAVIIVIDWFAQGALIIVPRVCASCRLPERAGGQK